MNLRDSLTQEATEALGVCAPDTIGPTQSIADAFGLMRAGNVGCVIVTEHGKPIGIFTERDLLRRVCGRKVPLDTPIAKVMTSPPQTIEVGTSVADVIRTMHTGGFRHMPVVDPSGCLQGVLSVKRIVAYLVEHFPAVVFNLPPHPQQEQAAREGA